MGNYLLSNSGIPYLRLGAGEPLILIHGLGEMKEAWNNQFELSNQFELIIPDLRGHGDHITNKNISIKNFAEDIISLLEELEIENAHICGLSLGGLVAQEIYRQRSDKCKSLMLVSTFHFMPKHIGYLLYSMRKLRANAITIEDHKKIAARVCLYSWSKENYQHFLDYYRPDRETYIRSVASAMTVNNIDLLSNIKVPTLIIGGQYDTVTPVWVQLLMHKQIGHSEFVIMRNTGHVAKLEAKETFNQTLREFLKKHEKQKPAC